MLVAFINSKGGVGKSTLAVHAAAWLAGRGRRIGFLDSDFQETSSQWISEALPGVPVALAHSMEAIEQAAGDLRAAADLVIADGPAGMAVDQSIALACVADLVIVPCGPSVADLRGVLSVSQLIERVRQERGDDKPQSVIVLNRFRRTRLCADVLEAAGTIGLPVARCTIGDRVAYADSVGQGMTVFKMGYTARTAAAELNVLFDEVLRGL